jgi:hypothetical protein
MWELSKYNCSILHDLAVLDLLIYNINDHVSSIETSKSKLFTQQTLAYLYILIPLLFNDPNRSSRIIRIPILLIIENSNLIVDLLVWSKGWFIAHNKISDITKKLLIATDVVLQIGYGSDELLEAWKDLAREKEGLSTEKSSDRPKCSPKEAHQYLTVVQARYPGFILPDINSICGREIWLGEYPVSPITKRQLSQPITPITFTEDVPPSVQESIEIIKRDIYIPTNSIRMADLIKDKIFFDRNDIIYPREDILTYPELEDGEISLYHLQKLYVTPN